MGRREKPNIDLYRRKKGWRLSKDINVSNGKMGALGRKGIGDMEHQRSSRVANQKGDNINEGISLTE